MQLDISEINHNYITRIIILSVFIFKNLRNQPQVYKQSVISFCKKRIPWKIDINIDTGPEMDLQDKRDITLENLLYDADLKTNNIITVYYETSFKKMSLNINVEDEEKYELFLYA